jgi:hypothetical protein
MKKSRTYWIGLVLLLLLALAAPFFIRGPQGRPLMSFDRIKTIMGEQFPVARQVDDLRNKAKETAAEIKEHLRSQPKPEPKPQEVEVPTQHPPETLYKWRDKKGTLHFTNRPPPDGVEYTTVEWEDTAKQ